MMDTLSRGYSAPKAPGAIFTILLTIGVNGALFAVLGWVNRRDVHREPDTQTIVSRQTYSMPKVRKRNQPVKKNQTKPKAKTPVKTVQSKVRKPKPTRPRHARSKPSMPSIRASLPSMTLNLRGNLALPVGSGELAVEAKPNGNGQTGLASNDGVDQPARAIYQVRPKYPLSAKRLGHTGTVRIELIARTSGLPKDARVIRSSGHVSLDQSALAAIRSWRFSPAVNDGEKVPVRCTINFTFELDR